MSERVQAAMVVVFLLLIGAVVYVLLSNDEKDAPAAKAPTHDPGEDLDSASKDPIGPLTFTVGKGDLVLRVMAGSCTRSGGPKLELSENQARTFHQIRVPQVDDGTGVSAASPAVRAIVFAEASSPATLSVGAADTKCKVHRYTTTDGGGTWKQESGPLNEWYLDPKSGFVFSPTAPTDSGCKKKGVAQLAPITKKTAKVFCASGTIRGTIDGGQTWTTAGKLKNTSAVVFTGAQTGYAAVADADCKSRIYSTVNGGLTWTPRGCILKEFVVPGLTGTAKRLVAGGSSGSRLSTDDGATWKVPKKK
jgi:hypothetical protein